MTFRHLKNLDAISTLKNIRDRVEVAPGVRSPPTAVVSYMSVRTGSFRYRYRLDLSQSVRGGANGAWPRTRQKWGWARKGQFGECAAGRRSRSPGTAEINPGVVII